MPLAAPGGRIAVSALGRKLLRSRPMPDEVRTDAGRVGGGGGDGGGGDGGGGCILGGGGGLGDGGGGGFFFLGGLGDGGDGGGGRGGGGGDTFTGTPLGSGGGGGGAGGGGEGGGGDFVAAPGSYTHTNMSVWLQLAVRLLSVSTRAMGSIRAAPHPPLPGPPPPEAHSFCGCRRQCEQVSVKV